MVFLQKERISNGLPASLGGNAWEDHIVVVISGWYTGKTT
jgi:hypothetical protein